MYKEPQAGIDQHPAGDGLDKGQKYPDNLNL